MGVLRSFLYYTDFVNLLYEVKYKRNKDGCSCKCNLSCCSKYQVYIPIRTVSLFGSFNLNLKIIFSWFENKNQLCIVHNYDASINIAAKIFSKLRKKPKIYFEDNKYRLGESNIVYQIDNSMFRYKQKYHVVRFNSEFG